MRKTLVTYCMLTRRFVLVAVKPKGSGLTLALNSYIIAILGYCTQSIESAIYYSVIRMHSKWLFHSKWVNFNGYSFQIAINYSLSQSLMQFRESWGQ